MSRLVVSRVIAPFLSLSLSFSLFLSLILSLSLSFFLFLSFSLSLSLSQSFCFALFVSFSDSFCFVSHSLSLSRHHLSPASPFLHPLFTPSYSFSHIQPPKPWSILSPVSTHPFYRLPPPPPKVLFPYLFPYHVFNSVFPHDALIRLVMTNQSTRWFCIPSSSSICSHRTCPTHWDG